jgi:hypothetical protein
MVKDKAKQFPNVVQSHRHQEWDKQQKARAGILTTYREAIAQHPEGGSSRSCGKY